MSHDELVLFKKGHTISVNDSSSPLFYFFDYKSRIGNIMDFQHFHQFYEIFIPLDDKIGHIIEGDYYPINKYDIVLLAPFLLHKTEFPPAQVRRCLIINFSIPHEDPCMDALFRPLLSIFNAALPIFRLSEEAQLQVFGVINEIFTLKLRQPPMMDLLVHSKFLEFLCLLYGYRNQARYVQEPTADFNTQRIYRLTSYIHTNFSQKLTLDALSERIFISPYHLSHLFRQVTGFTLINYIQMTRVSNAQQYLLSTNLQISEIGERCGFTSFSQFNRVFHKFCKTSPSQFRSNGHKEGSKFHPDSFLFSGKKDESA